MLNVNLKGTFFCAQAALPGMRERGWGRVVNTSSAGSLGNIGQEWLRRTLHWPRS